MYTLPQRSPVRRGISVRSNLDEMIPQQLNRVVVSRTGQSLHLIFEAILLNSLKAVKSITSRANTVNITDVNGLSILHYAVMNERFQIVEYLIKQGANVNTFTKDQNRSPLYSACMLGNKILISMLMNAGAMAVKDKYGWFPENGK